MTVGEILAKLEGVKREREGQWAAKCPAHDDRAPSLGITAGTDGRVLLFCHAGCKLDAIAKALGIAESDLFPPKDTSGRKREVARYEYRDEKGELLFAVVRFEPKDFRQCRPDGKGGWIWKLDDGNHHTRRVLYRLPELLAANAGEVVYVVEGEKDVDALRALGVVATCNPHGAGKWRGVAEHARKALAGRHVVVIPDNDEPGRAHAREAIASLRGAAKSLRILELPDLPPKGDASNFVAGGGTAASLLKLSLSTRASDARPELGGLNVARFTERVKGEIIGRRGAAASIVPYEVGFLDDALRGMLPHDLVVITARAGAGKTQLASMIAENATRRGRSALMFALEAEDAEVERRIKYRQIARRWIADVEPERVTDGRKDPRLPLSYGDWYTCRLGSWAPDIQGRLDELEADVDAELATAIGDRLITVYRSAEDFTVEHIERAVMAFADEVDVVVVDHLHFIDFSDGEEENAAVKTIMKRLRDLSLRVGKPVLLIAHVRKANQYRPTLCPQLDDIHGSSDIVKIATRVVSVAAAPREGGEWWMAPTYMQVLKDRLDGAKPFVARVLFDLRTGVYARTYELGVIAREKGSEAWAEADRIPPWAEHARPAGASANQETLPLGGG